MVQDQLIAECLYDFVGSRCQSQFGVYNYVEYRSRWISLLVSSCDVLHRDSIPCRVFLVASETGGWLNCNTSHFASCGVVRLSGALNL